MNEDNTRLCARCLQTVSEGRAEFYEVRIEAVADPSPPILDPLPQPGSDSEIEARGQLKDALREMSSQEAQDQVHRHVTLSLCNRCFHDWIEDPMQGEAG
jgi:hypothetical protein